MIRDGHLGPVDGYLTDALTDEALAFIDSQASDADPFYLSLHYTAPHAPWIDAHPEDLTELYRDCAFASIPTAPRHPWARQFHDVMRHAEQHPRENRIGYFAAVTGLDRGVGRVLDHLATRDLTRSTLVVFLSDNGFNAGHHGIWGKGNGTFPMNLYDTSVRVPCIWWQPGRIPAGVVDPGLRSGYDLMPTLLGYLGLGGPFRPVGPGRDFSPSLVGDDVDDHEFVVVHAEYGPARMIRTVDLKYVEREPYGPGELYDLREDPDETVNLHGDRAYRGTEHDLRIALRDWFHLHVDPRRDGAHLSVTGAGQHDVVDRRTPGPRVFEPHPEVTFPW
jgi:arylsulfatase A-like enzyme